MESFKKCETCKEWHWINESCDPEYACFYEDYTGDEGKIFRGSDHESAAIKMAIHINSSCEYINQDLEIEVQKVGEETRKKFIITPEPTIEYSCKAI